MPVGQPLVGTIGVGCDVADADPAEFDAVTVERRVWPASAAETVYVFPVAPAIVRHAPSASHRLHA